MINQKEPFALSREEKNSPLWRRLTTHWEDRLSTLRAQNDIDMPDGRTATLRGRISECKYNLSLTKDLPIIEAPPL